MGYLDISIFTIGFFGAVLKMYSEEILPFCFYGVAIIGIISLVFNIIYIQELDNPKKTPTNCQDETITALYIALPYDIKNFNCLDRAKIAKEVLSELGYDVKIELAKTVLNGSEVGHAWINVNGKEYWRGSYNYSINYSKEDIRYFLGNQS
jgi:hypothetical protein